MPIEIFELTDEKLEAIFDRKEDHYFDFKSKRISPAALSKSICAFANSDGGELYVGIEDPSAGGAWDGFAEMEDANPHIDMFENLFPLGGDFIYDFLSHRRMNGLVLRVEVKKSARLFRASDGHIYVRRGAQKMRLRDDESIRRLERQKGLHSHEDELLNTHCSDIENSIVIIEFMLYLVPDADPAPWLRKQALILDGRPTVAGHLLFSDEPQAQLPSACIKIYRYRTDEREGTRATLAFDPETIEGCAYKQIFLAVERAKEIIDSTPALGSAGLEQINYPEVALHEIITNAVLHRDYGINDSIHVRIFDTRVEIESPGRLHAHITPENILSERFLRNQKINRMLNKFEDPPNKDVGEGLNTTFRAMRDLQLRTPEIEERANSVLVTLRHEALASPEEIIISYLEDNEEINNSMARDICNVLDTAKMTKILQRMLKANMIEKIPNRAKSKAGYRKL